jgi:hypothetical protein
MTISYCKKNAVLLFLFFLFLWNGCTDTKQSKGNINVIDITRIHPENFYNAGEEVVSTEFIPLETNDEFLCAGKVVAFTDEIIVYHNNRVGGDILIFDRKGKALKKINRQGPGREEYARSNNDIVYDNANKELFVNSILTGKIAVYDLEGNFKRSFRQHTIYWEMENYDEELLICYTREENIDHPVFLISKQTGEKVRDIVIPYKKRICLGFQWRAGDEMRTATIFRKNLIKAGDEFIISEPSSDTVYILNPKESVLRPFLYRTPPIQTMPVPVFLLPTMKAGSFLFITCVRKEYNFEKGQGFPEESWVYDCRDGKFYNLLVFPKLFGGNIDVIHETRSNVFLVEFLADEMIEKFPNLTEDDNPVVLIVELKK